MALEFDGDLFDGDRGKVMKGILKRTRKNAAKPKPKKPKPAPVVEPLLSPAPYAQRIKDLLLATGWTRQDKDFLENWGFSAATVSHQLRGDWPATVLFIRRLVRLEAMYATELEAVHKGLIKMVKAKGHTHPVRMDLRRVKAVVEDGKRGL